MRLARWWAWPSSCWCEPWPDDPHRARAAAGGGHPRARGGAHPAASGPLCAWLAGGPGRHRAGASRGPMTLTGLGPLLGAGILVLGAVLILLLQARYALGSLVGLAVIVLVRAVAR